MSSIPPSGAQPPPPTTAQATPTALIREPSVEVLRLAAGTRIEGTVLPPPPPQADASRAAVQALQTAVDAGRAEAAIAQRAASPQAPAPTQAPSHAALPQTQPQAQPSPQAPQVQVRTPVGDLTLRTPLPLPEGARVAFDITGSTATQVAVRFATLNGQPIQQALVQLAADRPGLLPQPGTPATSVTGQTPQPGALTFGQTWTPGGPVSLTQAGPINAFVLAGTAAGSPTPGQQGFVTGSDLTIRITTVSPNPAGSAPPQGPAPGQVATPLQVSPTAAAGGPAPTSTPGSGPAAQATVQGQVQGPTPGPGALLPSGGAAQQGLRLVGFQGWPPPPFTTPTQVQSAPVQLSLTGTVTAQTTTAQPVIQTDAGTLQLGSRANLPPGSVVTLDVTSQTLPRSDAPAGAITQTVAPSPSLGTLPFAAGTMWPTLTEALQVLQRVDPQAAQLLANSLPDGGCCPLIHSIHASR